MCCSKNDSANLDDAKTGALLSSSRLNPICLMLKGYGQAKYCTHYKKFGHSITKCWDRKCRLSCLIGYSPEIIWFPRETTTVSPKKYKPVSNMALVNSHSNPFVDSESSETLSFADNQKSYSISVLRDARADILHKPIIFSFYLL